MYVKNVVKTVEVMFLRGKVIFNFQIRTVIDKAPSEGKGLYECAFGKVK